MKWAVLIAVVCGFMALAPMSARAGMYTMHTANTLGPDLGDQDYSSVGLEFNVDAASGINVLSLGIYDSSQNGINGGGTLSTLIFDANPTSLVQVDFTAASPGTLIGAYLFKPLAAPLYLAPGTYTISGYGFNTLDPEHNSKIHGSGPTFNGGGLISFNQSVWGAAPGVDVPPTFPTITGAPDYFDGPNMTFVPVPGAVLLGILGLGVAGLKLRKFS